MTAESAAPRPGRTADRDPARRGPAARHFESEWCLLVACCALHRHRQSARGAAGAQPRGSRSPSDGESAVDAENPGAGRGLRRRASGHFAKFPEALAGEAHVRPRVGQRGGPWTAMRVNGGAADQCRRRILRSRACPPRRRSGRRRLRSADYPGPYAGECQ